VSLRAVSLPKSALKYIVVHELSHIHTKRHSTKFWKVVETIYPDYEIGIKAFSKNKDLFKTLSIFSFSATRQIFAFTKNQEVKGS
jgi:predicted metal-dependent hydrolase